MSLGQLFDPVERNVPELEDEVAVFDTYIMLYQFLTGIVDRDTNDYVRNNRGEPISHLIGLFNRATGTMMAGVKPVFVFDGGFPELKENTVAERSEAKEEAREKFERARAEGDEETMRKYARQRVSISDEMLEGSYKLLDALGLPFIEAPSEGEAQAAQLVNQGVGDFVVSEDYDTLLYGTPRMVRQYNAYGCEEIRLQRDLDRHDMTQRELVWYAMLLGTDYNPGAHGVGPVGADKIVGASDSFPEVIERAQDRDDSVDEELWWDVYHWFDSPDVLERVAPSWQEPDFDAVREVLIERYGLLDAQVESRLADLANELE